MLMTFAAGSDWNMVPKVVEKTYSRFELRISSEMNKFLCIKIEDVGERLKRHHENMIQSMLKFFNMKECHPSSTPFPDGFSIRGETDSELLNEVTPYKKLTRCMLHLSNNTRPEISY